MLQMIWVLLGRVDSTGMRRSVTNQYNSYLICRHFGVEKTAADLRNGY